MSLRRPFPPFFEVMCFGLAYRLIFGAGVVGVAYVDGGDPKFHGPFGTFVFGVVLFVLPSTVASTLVYAFARWNPHGAALASGRWDVPFVVAATFVLVGSGVEWLSSQPYAQHLQLAPWYFWLLGGGALVTTWCVRALDERRASARDVERSRTSVTD